MNVFDMHHNSKELLAWETADVAAASVVDGEIIDTAGFEAAEFLFYGKTFTAGVVDFALWESDDSGMSGATVVPAAEQLGGVQLTTDGDTTRIGYIGKKRYVRAKMTAVGGTVTIADLTGMALLGNAMHQPTSD